LFPQKIIAMNNHEKKSNKRAVFYAYLLLFSSILILYSVVFGQAGENSRLLLGVLIFLLLLLFSYFSVTGAFLAVIFSLPFLIGADSYQLNIGQFLDFIAPNIELYVNPFSLACIFIVFLAIIEGSKRFFKIPKVPLFFLISFAIIISLISFVQSKYKLTGLVFELYFISGFMAYFLGYFLLGSKKNYLKTILVVIASSLIPIAVAFSQLAGGTYLFEADSDLGRVQSTFPHSNTFGSFLFVIATVFFVSLFAIKIIFKNQKATKRFEIFRFIPFIIIVGFLILTYSRTAWMGFVLAVLAVAIIKPKIRIPVAFLGSLSVGVMLLFQKTRDRIFGAFERYMYDPLYGRFEIWDMALFEARKKFLIGYGTGSFEEVIKESQGKDTGNVYPHNDAIRFSLESGILGLIGYILYMLGAIYYSLKSYLKFPAGIEKIKIWNLEAEVDFKFLGIIPLLLFGIMIFISFIEAPSMDFVYQLLAWTILGSWLGVSQKYWKRS